MLQFQGFHNFLEFYQIHHITSSPHHPQSNGFCWSFGRNFKEIDGKVHQRWKTMELVTTPIQSDTHIEHHSITTGSPQRQETEDFTSSDPFQHWKVYRKFQDLSGNWWNVNLLVLPPTTTWNSNQDGLYLWRKYMEMSGELALLTSQPRSLIPTESSFQTIPSWERHGPWSIQDHCLLISSLKLRAKRRTSQNLFPHMHPRISNQCSQVWSNQPYQ